MKPTNQPNKNKNKDKNKREKTDARIEETLHKQSMALNLHTIKSGARPICFIRLIEINKSFF
jgi:hypothetical protein